MSNQLHVDGCNTTHETCEVPPDGEMDEGCHVFADSSSWSVADEDYVEGPDLGYRVWVYCFCGGAQAALALAQKRHAGELDPAFWTNRQAANAWAVKHLRSADHRFHVRQLSPNPPKGCSHVGQTRDERQ